MGKQFCDENNTGSDGMRNPEYDIQKRARADTTALLRAVVAGYILYLGWNIVAARDSAMPPTAAKLAGAVFMTAAIAFGVYTWKRWRLDLEAARLPETENAASREDAESNDAAEL